MLLLLLLLPVYHHPYGSATTAVYTKPTTAATLPWCYPGTYGRRIFRGGDFPNWGGGELSPKFPLHSSVELPPKLRKFPSPRSFGQVYCTLKNPVIAVIQLLQSFNCISLIIR